MTPTPGERWRQVATLVDAILDRPPGERATYLKIACANDPRLGDEVDMIVEKGSARSFLDTGALVFAAPLLETGGPPNQARSRDGAVYELERELGRGGMATVYLARDPKHDRSIALKVLNAEFASAASEHFVHEIRLIGRLQHPLIVGLVDSGVFAEDAGTLAFRPYYSMPYVHGESLRERLARGPLSLGEATRVLHDVAEALAYAHAEGVVHRDVKPANILLSRGHAVVTDFGIATAVRLSHSAAPIGTPAYMAPEQMVPNEPVDARADLYAYGVVAYELLAGRHPFAGRNTAVELIAAHRSEMPLPLERVAPDLPRPLVSLVMRLLHKNASDRPQNADEILRVLQMLSVSPHANVWRRAAAVLVVAALATTAYAGVTRYGERPTVTSALRTQNPRARDLYLEGRRFWQQRTPESIRTATSYFNGAIAHDSNFVDAWAGLADVYVISPLFEVGSPRDLFPKAKVAARRALALDSTLAEAHASLARVEAQYDGDLANADHEFVRALAIKPADGILHQRYAELLWWRGRHAEALSEVDRAVALDSLSRVTNLQKGVLLNLARRPDDAIAQFKHTLQLDPEFAQAHASLGAAYLTKGLASEAVKELEIAFRRNEASYTAGLLAYAYATSGQRARAHAILRDETRRAHEHYVAPTAFAIIYAGLGDSATAIRWLERASEMRDPLLPFVLSYSFLDWLRADPRVAALVKSWGVS